MPKPDDDGMAMDGPPPAAASRAASSRYRKPALAAKRGIDIGGALVGLAVLSPVLAWTALAVFISQGPPILFRHQRPGLAGRPFTMLKFRTMRSPRPGEPWLGTDRERVTRLGRWLRSTSLDEIPELWNVLRGDMSLVGPRPLLTEYLDRYTAEELRRHDMRPGITGWAAVNGRHTLRFEDRLALDVWYVDNWSLSLDLRIIGLTVRQVLKGADVVTTQDLADIDFPDRFRVGNWED
jgi:sugar transferase EpsL